MAKEFYRDVFYHTVTIILFILQLPLILKDRPKDFLIHLFIIFPQHIYVFIERIIYQLYFVTQLTIWAIFKDEILFNALYESYIDNIKSQNDRMQKIYSNLTLKDFFTLTHFEDWGKNK